MKKIFKLLLFLILVYTDPIKAQENTDKPSLLRESVSTEANTIKREPIVPVFVQDEGYKEKEARIESDAVLDRASAEQKSRRRGVLLLAAIVVIVILLV